MSGGFISKTFPADCFKVYQFVMEADTLTPTALRTREVPAVAGHRVTPAAAAANPPATDVAPPVRQAIFVPIKKLKTDQCVIFKLC